MKGMTESQKDRFRNYLEGFKADNGGCLLCRSDIEEYYCVPAEYQGRLEVYVYGSCTEHTMLVDSDIKMDMQVVRLREEMGSEGDDDIEMGSEALRVHLDNDRPILMAITFPRGQGLVKKA